MSLKPDRLQLWHPFTRGSPDVYLMRRVVWTGSRADPVDGEVLTNVPQELWLWPTVRYGWGPQQRQGVTLALNILDRVIPGGVSPVCDDWHQPLACHPDALRFAVRFYEAFLCAMPFSGGRLAGADVRDWVSAERRLWDGDGVHLGAVEPIHLWPDWRREG